MPIAPLQRRQVLAGLGGLALAPLIKAVKFQASD